MDIVSSCYLWSPAFGERTMKRFSLIVLLLLLVPSFPTSAEANHKYLYLCRSPLLAFDFW